VAPGQAERRLAAIMFTDIVGYTVLMARDEEAARRARDRHEAVVHPLVERYHGQWIERTGDETLSSFSSALDAVSCALAIQNELSGDSELRVRIGIHQGDVTFDASGISGDGVNVAARVRPLAEPGGICISSEVHHSVRGRPDLDFRSLGEQELKNVDRPFAVFAVTGRASPPRPASAARKRRQTRRRLWAAPMVGALIVAALGAWWLSRPAADAGPIRFIAVLPLENLSGDPEQEYFADGMTEALIGDLAKLGSLSVISRTSVMRYKHTDRSLPDIAQELGVDAVIEGTVMRADERVRITVQLIDARSDTHLWADRYDRELRDVFALHSDVARAVAEQIRLELTSEERAALSASRSVDPRAYDAYVRGIQVSGALPLIRVWGPQAIEQFERAVELDPGFAEAYTALARARIQMGNFLKGRDAAERAVELDDRLSGAHAMRGLIRAWYDWDFAEARRDLERAMELGPSDPLALLGYSLFLMATGRVEEAIEVTERLLRVAPLDASFRDDRLKALFYARQYERVLEEAEQAREIDPAFEERAIADSYAMLGRLEAAHRTLVATDARCGEPCAWSREAQERGWAEAGWEGATRALLEAAMQREGYSPFWIAISYAGLGETEEALAWLERGYRERDPMMFWIKVHPTFDPLRSDPRFDDLLRRIGFPES
jgi:TolB-like protein/Tfp pilus assembly protein PilF